MIKGRKRLEFGGAVAALMMLAACNPKPTTSDASGAANAVAATQSSALPPLPGAAPLTDAPATPLVDAPAASALPAAAPMPLARPAGGGDYAYIDRADALDQVIGDAPPDYYFDYDGGVEPWAWQTGDGYETFAEPIDGGYRYYYYQPGDNYPYYVRDPDYGYAYSGGNLVVVYDRAGRALDARRAMRERAAAARYYARARELYAASRHSDRRGVSAPQWDQRRAEIARSRAASESRNADRRQAAAREAAHWQGEQQQRRIAAQRYDQWRGRGEHGSPPPLYGAPAHAGAPRKQPPATAAQRQAVQRERAEQQDRLHNAPAGAHPDKGRPAHAVIDRTRADAARQAAAQARTHARQQRDQAHRNAPVAPLHARSERPVPKPHTAPTRPIDRQIAAPERLHNEGRAHAAHAQAPHAQPASHAAREQRQAARVRAQAARPHEAPSAQAQRPVRAAVQRPPMRPAAVSPPQHRQPLVRQAPAHQAPAARAPIKRPQEARHAAP